MSRIAPNVDVAGDSGILCGNRNMGITGEIADGTIGFGGFFAFVQTADIDITVQTQGFRLDVKRGFLAVVIYSTIDTVNVAVQYHGVVSSQIDSTPSSRTQDAAP